MISFVSGGRRSQRKIYADLNIKNIIRNGRGGQAEKFKKLNHATDPG